MGIFRSLAGMVQVELTSADIAGSLTAINSCGIRINGADYRDDLTVCFRTSRRDWKELLELTQKRGETLRIIGRQGLYWSLKQLLGRKLFVIGLSFLLALVLFVPTRIYFVQVEGNQSVPSRLILEAARESGIAFGASRREVRSERVKNELLSALPQLQWAGINTYGCVAVISVRERSTTGKPEEVDDVCSIVAAQDGIILSCTATKGNLLCAPGQAVQAGEVLISGYTDCGLTITATRAEGEILAETSRNLEAVTPSEYQIRGLAQSQTTKYSLIIGKKRINFYKGSGIWDATCGKMYTEYHLTLPGGFRLPVTLVKEVTTSYETVSAETEETDAEQQLHSFAERYLRQIMVAGRIANSDCSVICVEGVYRLTGEFSCIEMIGKVRYEEIGAYNGKTD